MRFTDVGRVSVLAAGAIAFAAACSAASSVPPDPCAACANYPTVGAGDAGSPDATVPTRLGIGCYHDRGVPIMCRPMCNTTADCSEPGHACIDNEGVNLCDPYCKTNLCATNAECGSPCGTCQQVGCGLSVACDAGAVCSLEQHQCFTASGVCSTTPDCPSLDTFLVQSSTLCGSSMSVNYGEVTCVDARCRWQFPTLTLTAGNAAHIAVTEPSPNTTFLDQASIGFTWTASPYTVIAYVLSDVPHGGWTDVKRLAIWGYVAPPSSTSSVSWNMGETVSGDQWTNGPPMAPTTQALYFVVEEVDQGILVGVSDVVPFVVGPSWPQVGSACTPESAVPDGCFNPSRPPQLCYNGQCQRLCASDADCASGHSCAAAVLVPQMGGTIRYCQ